LAGCGPGVDREGTLSRLRAAIDEDVSSETVLEEHNQLVEQVRDGNVLDGMRRSEVEAALGRGQECGTRPICAQHGFRATDWIYEVGQRDGLPWGPTIVIGFDRQGIVDNVYTLTRR
ncbi:MAG TPA: hypothetical protein VIL20_26550, partial [Sandaracinaceae bacterium]